MNRYVGADIRERGGDLPESFDAFRVEALADGCDEALVREWRADQVVGTHAHPFVAEAVVVRGEMWLSEGGRTWHLERGGSFRIGANVPHAERYGPEGATFWVGRRSVAP